MTSWFFISGICLEPTQLCDFTDDCGDLWDEKIINCKNVTNRCSFENGESCYWIQETTDSANWNRWSGLTPNGMSQMTGPARDHTTGLFTGYYMYLDSTNTRLNDTAILSSQTIKGMYEFPYCVLRFYYYMYGKDIHKLDVNVKYLNSGKIQRLAGIEEVDDIQLWNKVEIEHAIRNENDVIQFQIIGTSSGEALGDIAIDDISLYGCQVVDFVSTTTTTTTTDIPTTPHCADDEFDCFDGQHGCFKFSELCDYIKQCSNGRDEAYCGACTFEKDECGWFNEDKR